MTQPTSSGTNRSRGAPTLSVAIPVLNGANYLQAALDSLAAQDDQDFEIVVSENFSSDATPEILRRFAATRPRVLISRTDRIIPQAENVNRVARLCSGDWIKFLCHDDLLEPDCISTLRRAVNEVESPNVGLIGNAEVWLFANGVRRGISVDGPWLTTWNGLDFVRAHLRGAPSPPLAALTTACVRKEAFDGFPGFDARFVHFDIFLWLRLLQRWDYAFVSRVLTVNRIHPEQVFPQARFSMKSIADYRVFWREFLAESPVLGLSRAAKWRVLLKPIGAAATYIVMELMKRRPISALRMAGKLPFWWWPFLPIFVLRSWMTQRGMVAGMRSEVPVTMIYPG